MDIAQKGYEWRFRKERITGMKGAVKSLGYRQVPGTESFTRAETAESAGCRQVTEEWCFRSAKSPLVVSAGRYGLGLPASPCSPQSVSGRSGERYEMGVKSRINVDLRRQRPTAAIHCVPAIMVAVIVRFAVFDSEAAIGMFWLLIRSRLG